MKSEQRRCRVNSEERDCNPIYKVVHNKIRNLNKKLTQIHQLQSLQKKSLSQAQLAKIAKKDQITNQLAKQQDFLTYYKQILIENNLIYDKVDDLIKISALLTVGNKIEKQKYCPDQTKELYHQIYNQIFNKSIYSGKNQLSDEIIRVYHILESYLEQNKYYQQCRDYMTYIKEIDEKSKIKKEFNSPHSTAQIIEHVEKINQLIKGNQLQHHAIKHAQKSQRLVIIKEVIKYEHQNISLSSEIQSLKSKLNIKLTNQTYSPKLEKVQTSDSTLPDIDDLKKDIQSEIIQQELDEKLQVDYQFNKKREDRENNSQDKMNYSTTANNSKSKRRRKNKKNNFVQVQNIRKCSDASLEPIAQKQKTKKVKYVEKVE